ncbi:MAG: acyclic terpene utilization AtuA family protein, partial [Cytophagia bacterium]|nr:acyclic terpene utilization AtuA family protein [Cytophagia bacterium]
MMNPVVIVEVLEFLRDAEVVITGRCVDSAATLGVLTHEFGWGSQDHD